MRTTVRKGTSSAIVLHNAQINFALALVIGGAVSFFSVSAALMAAGLAWFVMAGFDAASLGR